MIINKNVYVVMTAMKSIFIHTNCFNYYSYQQAAKKHKVIKAYKRQKTMFVNRKSYETIDENWLLRKLQTWMNRLM